MTIRLLIADDNVRVREGVKLLLNSTGIEVVAEANTCEEAVRTASQPDLDGLLLDIKFPDGNGLDVLARIKSERPNLPALIHSDADSANYLSRSYALGAAGYLLKGLDRTELLGAIRQAMTGKDVWTEAQLQTIQRSQHSARSTIAEQQG